MTETFVFIGITNNWSGLQLYINVNIHSSSGGGVSGSMIETFVFIGITNNWSGLQFGGYLVKLSFLQEISRHGELCGLLEYSTDSTLENRVLTLSQCSFHQQEWKTRFNYVPAWNTDSSCLAILSLIVQLCLSWVLEGWLTLVINYHF